jgi:hypothetical protein
VSFLVKARRHNDVCYLAVRTDWVGGPMIFSLVSREQGCLTFDTLEAAEAFAASSGMPDLYVVDQAEEMLEREIAHQDRATARKRRGC